MNETDRKNARQEHWDSVNRLDFGTDDGDAIRSMLKQEWADWQRLQSSLGGFLYLLREGRRQTVPKIAAEAKVKLDTWESWEGDVIIPSGPELDKLTKNLNLSDIHAKQLLKLWHQSPFQSLRRLAEFRPQLLAARGVARVESESQWELLHPEAQAKLLSWAKRHRKYSLPRQLLDLIASLDLDPADGPESWAREVWNANV